MSEVLVLGGGLAGGAAAALLARAGVPVRLLERQAGPHDKICGEFVSVEAARDLVALGLDPLRLGAVPIGRVRLACGAHTVEAALPFAALGLSRKVLDEALLELAAASGALVERGVRVTRLAGGEAGTSAGPRCAGRVVLATGKHDLRGLPRASRATGDPHVGFKMHWRPERRQRAELASFIELVLFDGGYAGLQMVSADTMNLCLIVRRSVLARAGACWEGLLARLLDEPWIARRLGDAEPLFARPLAISNLPYGYLREPGAPPSGAVFCLGDQAAMTPSLTGDGMALALHSARLAARSLAAGEGAGSYHRQLRASLAPQVRRAMVLQRASEFPLAMQAGFALVRLWPGLLASLAGATRLPRWNSA